MRIVESREQRRQALTECLRKRLAGEPASMPPRIRLPRVFDRSVSIDPLVDGAFNGRIVLLGEPTAEGRRYMELAARRLAELDVTQDRAA